MVICPICNRRLGFISASHLLRAHNINSQKFKADYPNCRMSSEEKKKATSASCKASGCGKWKLGSKWGDAQKKILSVKNKGEGNPFYGKKHTTKTRRKMSRNHADFSGNKNPYRKAIVSSPEKREAAKKRSQAIWINMKKDKNKYKKYRELRSKLSIKQILKGKHLPYGRGHKHGWITVLNKKIYYRSSYELRFLVCCDKSKLVCNPCKISIPYQHDGVTKNYLPDFIVKNTIIEIKPKALLAYDLIPLKIAAGIKYCNENNYKYLVITEKELKEFEAGNLTSIL